MIVHVHVHVQVHDRHMYMYMYMYMYVVQAFVVHKRLHIFIHNRVQVAQLGKIIIPLMLILATGGLAHLTAGHGHVHVHACVWIV